MNYKHSCCCHNSYHSQGPKEQYMNYKYSHCCHNSYHGKGSKYQVDTYKKRQRINMQFKTTERENKTCTPKMNDSFWMQTDKNLSI